MPDDSVMDCTETPLGREDMWEFLRTIEAKKATVCLHPPSHSGLCICTTHFLPQAQECMESVNRELEESTLRLQEAQQVLYLTVTHHLGWIIASELPEQLLHNRRK